MSDELKQLRLADFEKVVGSKFWINFDNDEGNPIEYPLILKEASLVGIKERDIEAHGRESFSLVFTNDNPQQHLIQHTYQVQHAELGENLLFLVPIGVVDNKVQYEVIFT